MTRVEAELLAAVDGIARGLRAGPALEATAAERLRASLRAAAQAWMSSPSISKLAANILVDLAPAIQASADAYPEPDAQRIRDFSIEIADLVRDCVGVDDEGA